MTALKMEDTLKILKIPQWEKIKIDSALKRIFGPFAAF